jgi:hypothetical protein
LLLNQRRLLAATPHFRRRQFQSDNPKPTYFAPAPMSAGN